MKKLLIIFSIFLFGCGSDKKIVNKNEKILIDIIEVSISGEVYYPGVYEISEYLTYKDFFKICKIKETADISKYNLDEKVDERTIFITRQSSELININTAKLEELMNIVGIKIKLATNIIEYRKKNGFFNSIEEIMNVNGIKEKKFELIKDYICV